MTDHLPPAGEAAPRATCPTLRPEVLAFAQAMEIQLKMNDWKGGWQNEDVISLFPRVTEELEELRSACFGLRQNRNFVLREAADVANFLMMVADVLGVLTRALPPPAPDPLTALERELAEIIADLRARIASHDVPTIDFAAGTFNQARQDAELRLLHYAKIAWSRNVLAGRVQILEAQLADERAARAATVANQAHIIDGYKQWLSDALEKKSDYLNQIGDQFKELDQEKVARLAAEGREAELGAALGPEWTAYYASADPTSEKLTYLCDECKKGRDEGHAPGCKRGAVFASVDRGASDVLAACIACDDAYQAMDLDRIQEASAKWLKAMKTWRARRSGGDGGT